MTKRTLWSKVGCLVAAGGLVAGCGMETLPEPDAQLMGEVRQAIANGKRFNAYGEPAGVAARADLQVYRRTDNTWWARRTSDGAGAGYTLNRTPAAEDVPVQGNFDGDALYDQATFRPSTGVWHIRRSSDGAQYSVQYGQSGDIPTPGDFDGDGKSDVSVWRPSSGTFFVTRSSMGVGFTVQYGQLGDIPVVGDYDGDGKDDFAVWRPCTGIWYYGSNARQYGQAGDIPVPGDYDGDGKTDIAVFRPSGGHWFIIRSSTNAGSTTQFGGLKDYPQPADYDGDGKTDISVFRPSEGRHYMLYSSTNSGTSMDWGISSDVVVNTNVYCTGGGGVQPCNSDNVNGCSTQYCVTVTGSAEWCGPVPGIVRYTTSTPGSYTVARNSNCQNFSGGTACQYELYRNGVKVTDSGVGRWYSVNVSTTSGACAPAQPQTCGVRADSNVTLP
jgi:hypothetical protein